MGHDEAAPSQKLAEEKVVQVKTGPSRCLAETGWSGTCKKDRESVSIQLWQRGGSGQSPNDPEQQAVAVARGPDLACVWISAVCSFTEDRPVPTPPEPPTHSVTGPWHLPTLTQGEALKLRRSLISKVP